VQLDPAGAASVGINGILGIAFANGPTPAAGSSRLRTTIV
jgi:hypothetical protein